MMERTFEKENIVANQPLLDLLLLHLLAQENNANKVFIS